MGDIAVDIFLETLKQLITNSKLRLTMGENHQLQSLEMEIKYLREFLKVTEKKRNEHIEVMNLVRQIRDVVLESENTVELFVGRAYKQDQLSGWDKFFDWLSPRKMFRWDRFCELLLCKLLCNDQDYLSLDLGSARKEIKSLTAKVKQIYDKNMYDINRTTVRKSKHSFIGSSGSGRSSSLGGRSTSKVEEKVVVGFKDEIDTLMGKLHDSGEAGRLEILSVISIGGGGKTTLAREVYDHPLTLQKFEIRAWANVSQDYNKTMKRDLLISIMESASQGKHEDYRESSEDKLGEKVFKCLQGRKFLIVMDDIWGIEAWNDIQRSFPRGCKGSKVLFTSRQPVQPNGVRCIPHFLNSLSKSCSWELLQKKVFRKEDCPLKLVDIGKQIAEKCKGLPLAIVAIAGILATEEKTLDVWEKVAKHLSSIIAKNQEGCMDILELSYNHLPLHLKACFLYIGGYLEDYEIPIRELIWLWIAEGFIQQSEEGKSLEAIAKDYLSYLIDRSLVMVAKKSESHGGIRACCIHDLLRELCLKKAEEDSFFVQNYRDDSFSPSATNKHRRLFIGGQFFHKFFQKFSPRPCAQNLRSFLYLSLPNSSNPSLEQNLSFFGENFELLRVLHLMSAPSLGEIAIGDLVHLRYLALTLRQGHTYLGLNPLSDLSNLETLNFQVLDGDCVQLPRYVLVKMVKLRHLYTKKGRFCCHNIFNYDEEEENMLDSLQTLHRMCACEHCLRFLERTPNLRKLGLAGNDYTLTPNTRKLGFAGNDYILRYVELDLEFLKCLEILYVGSTWIGLKPPPTLTRLTLHDTYMKWEEMSIILQTLQSLEVLKLLRNACIGPVWNTCELEEGFSPQLKYLKLQQLDIKEWSASEEQFPGLEVLVINSCRKLGQIPIDFGNLNELCEIKVEYSLLSAEESAREIQEKQRYTKGDDDCLTLILFWNEFY